MTALARFRVWPNVLFFTFFGVLLAGSVFLLFNPRINWVTLRSVWVSSLIAIAAIASASYYIVKHAWILLRYRGVATFFDDEVLRMPVAGVSAPVFRPSDITDVRVEGGTVVVIEAAGRKPSRLDVKGLSVEGCEGEPPEACAKELHERIENYRRGRR